MSQYITPERGRVIGRLDYVQVEILQARSANRTSDINYCLRFQVHSTVYYYKSQPMAQEWWNVVNDLPVPLNIQHVAVVVPSSGGGDGGGL